MGWVGGVGWGGREEVVPCDGVRVVVRVRVVGEGEGEGGGEGEGEGESEGEGEDEGEGVGEGEGRENEGGECMEILFLIQPTLSFLPPPLSSLSLLCPLRVDTGQYGRYTDHDEHMGRRVEGDGEWVGRTRERDQHRQRRRVVHPGSPASMLFRVVVVVCGWWWSRVREVGGSGVWKGVGRVR